MTVHRIDTPRTHLYYDDVSRVVTLSTGRTFAIDKILERVRERYNELPLNLRTVSCQFNIPRWQECPNMIFSPAGAKIIHNNLV